MSSQNQQCIIRSHGIGEIMFDEWESACYQADHFSFNKLQEIPFFKLLLRLNALHLKYLYTIVNQPLPDRILLRDSYIANIDLMKTFEDLQELCDNLFANAYIKNMADAILQFNKFMNDIEFDFFDYGETKDIMDEILIKVDNFDKHLNDVLNYLVLIMGKSFFITKEILKEDFFNQLYKR